MRCLPFFSSPQKMGEEKKINSHAEQPHDAVENK